VNPNIHARIARLILMGFMVTASAMSGLIFRYLYEADKLSLPLSPMRSAQRFLNTSTDKRLTTAIGCVGPKTTVSAELPNVPAMPGIS
jgi:hypothetical protein